MKKSYGKRKAYLLFFSFLFLSLFLVSALDVSENPSDNQVTGVNMQFPAVTFNNNTASVNTSEYTNCWITTEGVKCDVSDILHSDLSNLNWDVAGHIINSNIDMNDHLLEDMSVLVLSGGGYIGDFDGYLDVASNLTPQSTLFYDLGTGSLRWRWLYVQNISAENIDAYNLYLSNNLTIDGYINGINISNLSRTYVPYTGATANVNLADKSLTTTQIYFDTPTNTIYDDGASHLTISSASNVHIIAAGSQFAFTGGNTITPSTGNLLILGGLLPSGVQSIGSATYPWYNGYFSSNAFIGSGGSILTLSGGGVSSSSGALSFATNTLLTSGNVNIGSDTNGLQVGASYDKKFFANDTGGYLKTQVGATPWYIDNTLIIENLNIRGKANISANNNFSIGSSTIYNDGTHLRIIPDGVAGTGDIYIGNKQAGVDYRIFVDGESNTGIIDFDEDNDRFQLNDKWWFVNPVSVGGVVPSADTMLASKFNTAGTTSNQLAISGQLLYGTNSDSNTIRGYYGGYFEFVTASTYTGNITGSGYGIKGINNHYGSGIIDDVYGLAFQNNNRLGGNITNAVTIYAQPTLNLGAGGIGTATGLLLDEQSSADTNWQVYSVAGDNYFGDGNHTFIGNVTINGNLNVDGCIVYNGGSLGTCI